MKCSSLTANPVWFGSQKFLQMIIMMNPHSEPSGCVVVNVKGEQDAHVG